MKDDERHRGESWRQKQWRNDNFLVKHRHFFGQVIGKFLGEMTGNFLALCAEYEKLLLTRYWLLYNNITSK